jgi:predicted enzyme related to lactoylglutathione lyase
MHKFKKGCCRFTADAAAIALLAGPAAAAGPAVGAQYDSTHVYVAPGSLDAFVHAFVATFGGKPSTPVTINVLPVPANTEFQYVWSSAGTLSVFAFLTPIPSPFGQERTGWLVNDMDAALTAARDAGAEVIVDKFKDAIGYDAVIQWPGGLKTQLYWHFTAPSYPPLETIPDNRVYLSGDSVNTFVRDFLKFSGGTVVSDESKADAGEIGKPGEWYRRIRIESGFGRMQVMVTDGHLPYPFGREITGYAVKDLDTTLAKAKAAGANVISPRFEAVDRSTIMMEFPGGYIAELHALKGERSH